jgi:predicted transposase YbfD/YdcC
MCQSIREEADGKCSFEIRYFIGSKRAKARYYGQRMRGHWRVENNLHWQLDVTFREDESRIRERTAATNFAVVRRLALNLTKHEDTEMSIAKKRFAAALDTDYLEKVLEVGKIG